jgi:hypothetical protein
MARLDITPYPGDWKDYRNHDALMDAIPQDKIIKFQVADGFAFYFVKSKKPLVLQHIPFYDGYRIPQAHLRGLRLSDVKTMLQQEAALARLFSKRE